MVDIILQIEFESDIPIYLQIKNQIIRGIATGELKLGEDLPSVRQLASDIGINFHTVNKVYTQLKQEGWVVVHRKSGVIINPELKVEKNQDYMTSLADSLGNITSEAFLRGVTKSEFLSIIEAHYAGYKKEGK